MDIQKLIELIASYKRSDVDYDCITESDSQNGRYVNGLKIKFSLSIGSPGFFEHALANKIAQRYSITFEEQDVNRGTGDPPSYKPFFSIICRSEDEVKTKVDAAIEAKDELNSKFENLAELVMKTR